MINYEVKILKLKSGEDIISGILRDETSDVLLDTPLQIHFKRTLDGNVLILLPWIPYELVSISMALINKSDILTILEPKDSMIKYYESCVEKVSEKMILDDFEEVLTDSLMKDNIDLTEDELEEIEELKSKGMLN
jgi:hypothetical protein